MATVCVCTALSAISGGCSQVPYVASAITGASEVAHLPALSASEQLRDQVARSETAIVDRTDQLTELATECDDCATALFVAATSAEDRLEAVGGLWKPWGEYDRQSGAEDFVEIPAAVGDAPYTVPALAASMYRSAQEQLQATAESSDITADDRLALGSLLSGRVASAQLLAAAFHVNMSEQVSSLPSGATAPSVESADNQQSGADDAGEGDEFTEDASPPQSSDEPADESASDSLTPPERALVEYDCIRSALLVAPADEIDSDTGAALAQELNARVAALVAGGTQDFRALRCTLPSAALPQLLNDLLVADLRLFASSTLDHRLDASRYLSADATTWAQVSPSTVPQVSVVTIERDDVS